MTLIRLGQLTPGTKVLQPGTSWQEEDTGIVRRFETWRCNAADLLTLMPQRGTAHPTYPQLTVKRRNPVDLEAGLCDFTLEYSGLGAGVAGGEGEEEAELPNPVYGLSRSQKTEPITTHLKWSDELKTAIGEANIVYDDSGLFLGISKDSIDKMLVGVTDYLSFGATFYKRSVQYEEPNPAGVGFIDTPPAKAPSVGGAYNWLKVAADYEEEGLVYSVYEAWMLSGPGGWHDIIYTT